MAHRFVAQPYGNGFDLRDFFDLVVDDDSIVTLDVVVAWVKRTGLNLLRPSIDEFRSRGGTFRAVAGISQGGTSRQGLTILHDLADQAFVFHHPGRTFHPKLYLATGAKRGLVMVGSHNLTRGGATANYEAAILSDLDRAEPTDETFLTDIAAYIARLIDDTNLCIPLEPALIERLDSNPRYRLADEDTTEEQPVDPFAEPSGDVPPATRADEESAALFGTSKHAMRSPPPIRQTATSTRGLATSTRAKAPLAPAKTADPASHVDPVVKRWFKTLLPSDAQQLSGSNPSNTMTLVQAGHPINAATYFRTEFFGSELWSTSETTGGAQQRELATIDCDVIVRGTPLGTHTFQIRHTPGYDANQGNRTTELAWREFGGYLRAHSLTDAVATLEKTAAGHYRLTIDDAPAGDFRF